MMSLIISLFLLFTGFYPPETVQIKYSRYWPPLGGTNCSNFVNGECISRMASGERWQDWVNKAVACPSIWPFGTKVILTNQEWICLDRGGKIILPYVDFLSPTSEYGYGTYITVTVFLPIESDKHAFLSERVQQLSTAKIDTTQPNQQITPSLHVIRHYSITEFSIEVITYRTNDHRKDHSQVSFQSTNRYTQIQLQNLLIIKEKHLDSWTPQKPEHYSHRNCIRNYCIQ